MVGPSKSLTKADKVRHEIIREVGCLACHIEGWPVIRAEVHHELDDGGERYDDEHRYTVGLCIWHHRGGKPRAMGPRLGNEKRKFDHRYGDRDQRLTMQDSIVRIVLSARRRGEFLGPLDLMRVVQSLHREVVLDGV